MLALLFGDFETDFGDGSCLRVGGIHPWSKHENEKRTPSTFEVPVSWLV